MFVFPVKDGDYLVLFGSVMKDIRVGLGELKVINFIFPFLFLSRQIFYDMVVTNLHIGFWSDYTKAVN